MQTITGIIENYSIYIIMGLAVLTIIVFVFTIINDVRISKLSRKYRKFMRGSKDKNIEEVMLALMDKVDEFEEKSKDIKVQYEEVDARLKKCVQKVSMTRYRAFEDIGSAALSFSIALLDEDDSGVIITGIYGRNESTTYAKPVDKGVPKYDLSEEEKNVLQDAMKKKANI